MLVVIPGTALLSTRTSPSDDVVLRLNKSSALNSSSICSTTVREPLDREPSASGLPSEDNCTGTLSSTLGADKAPPCALNWRYSVYVREIRQLWNVGEKCLFVGKVIGAKISAV